MPGLGGGGPSARRGGGGGPGGGGGGASAIRGGGSLRGGGGGPKASVRPSACETICACTIPRSNMPWTATVSPLITAPAFWPRGPRSMSARPLPSSTVNMLPKISDTRPRTADGLPGCNALMAVGSSSMTLRGRQFWASLIPPAPSAAPAISTSARLPAARPPGETGRRRHGGGAAFGPDVFSLSVMIGGPLSSLSMSGPYRTLPNPP